MTYFKQLDAYRAFAMIFVLISHWIKPGAYHIPLYVHTHFGSMGVVAFFVLSGFLITNILINAKSNAAVSGLSPFAIIKNFYGRRFLRIFPVYYLVLACLVMLALFNVIEIVKQDVLYSAFYLSNYYLIKVFYWTDYTSHFWSLAVEEQMYLVWPFIVIFLNRRLIAVVIAFMLVAGTYYNVIATSIFDFLDTKACVDSFGAGALYAWMRTYKKVKIDLLFRWLTIASILLVVTTVIQECFYSFKFPQRTTYNCCALWLVIAIAERKKIALSYGFRLVADSSVFRFLGKISYGMYVYHLYLPYILNKLLVSFFGIHVEMQGVSSPNILFLATNFVLLVAVSWLSFRLIEQPLLSFKKRFSTGFVKPETERTFLPDLARS